MVIGLAVLQDAIVSDNVIPVYAKLTSVYSYYVPYAGYAC